MRLIRTMLAVLTVLALTATMALAGREDTPPPAADHGIDTASAASGHDVPVRANEELEEPEVTLPDEGEDPLDEVDEELTELDEEAGPEVEPVADGESHCIDPAAEAGGEVDGEEPNHGALVCGAARFGDWEAAGCANHGQYVRTFANKNFDGEPGECEPAETGEGEATGDTLAVVEEPSVANGGNGATNGRGGNGNGNGGGNGNGRP